MREDYCNAQIDETVTRIFCIVDTLITNVYLSLRIFLPISFFFFLSIFSLSVTYPILLSHI